MKQWGVVALLTILLVGSVRQVKALGCDETVVLFDNLYCKGTTNACAGVTGEYCDMITNFTTNTIVYFETGTSNPLPVAGGYSDADIQTILDYQAAAGGGDRENTSTGRTVGTVYGTYGNGMPMRAGFYLAPNNGRYYPIDASKKATRHWKGKGEQPVYNCPDDMEPYFGEGAEVVSQCKFSKLPPGGNRVKWLGWCGCYEWQNVEHCGHSIIITSTCKLKCPDHGTKFKGIYKWVCPKGDQDNCFSNMSVPPRAEAAPQRRVLAAAPSATTSF